MCDWNTLKPYERLKQWKHFRQSIAEFSDDDKMKAVAKYFATVPIGTRTVDYYTPASWLTPWEILYERTYCQSSTSLLMYHTLKMVLDAKIDLALIDDGQDLYLVPVIDDIYTMNYELGKMSSWDDIKSNIDIKQYFTEEEVKQIT